MEIYVGLGGRYKISIEDRGLDNITNLYNYLSIPERPGASHARGNVANLQ